MKKPLEGIRVIDMTTFLAAPQCCRMLRALGADVVKIEAPDVEFFRIEAPIFECGIPCTEEENPIYLNSNAGKRMISLDLKHPKAKEVVHRMVKNADVLVTNMRRPPLIKLGLDYDALKDLNPALVYAHLDGYGVEGADAPKPGFDTQAYLARGGFLLDPTTPDAEPNFQVLGAGDCPTGVALLCGVLSALISAKKTGKGRFIKSSLYSSALWAQSMNMILSQYGFEMPAGRQKPSATALDNIYPCKDGEWLVLSAGDDPEAMFKTLCEKIGAAELAADSRFNTLSAMHENKEAMAAALEAVFATRDYAEWKNVLTGSGIAFDKPLKNILELPRDEQAPGAHFIERNYPSGKTMHFATPPFEFDGVVEDLDATCHFGEKTLEVLGELGYTEAEIAELLEEKAAYGYRLI